MMRPWLSALLVVGPSMLGCGGETPAPLAPESTLPAATEPAPDAPPSVPSETPADPPATAPESSASAAAADGTPAAPDKNATETRTSEVVALIIKENRKPFRDCYDKSAKELPDLQGTLTLHFVLDPEGKVKAADLNQERSTIKTPAVVDCAVGVLKGLKFPKSSRGMESVINYPFDFKR